MVVAIHFFSIASIHPSNFIDVNIAACSMNIWKTLYQWCSCQHKDHRVYHSYMVMIFIVQSINMSSQAKRFTIGHKVSTANCISHIIQGGKLLQLDGSLAWARPIAQAISLEKFHNHWWIHKNHETFPSWMICNVQYIIILFH